MSWKPARLNENGKQPRRRKASNTRLKKNGHARDTVDTGLLWILGIAIAYAMMFQPNAYLVAAIPAVISLMERLCRGRHIR